MRTVKRLTDVKSETWDEFILQNNGHVFQTYEWCQTRKTKYRKPLFLVVEGENEWTSVWPLFIVKLPVVNISCISIQAEPVFKRNKHDDFLLLLETLDALSQQEGVASISWVSRISSRWRNQSGLQQHGFQIEEYGSYLIDLNLDEAVLWAKLHGKHRNDIRKAQKTGIVVEETQDISKYHALSFQTFQRSHSEGPSLGELQKTFEILYPQEMCRVYLAKKDGDVLAAAFMLMYGDTVFYWQGASAAETLGASNLLHWELMKRFKCEGRLRYDFGGATLAPPKGSKLEGINRFKSRFGAELEIFYGGCKIISPFRHNLFNRIATLRHAILKKVGQK